MQFRNFSLSHNTSFISFLSSLFDGDIVERCHPFRSGMKPNAARGTSTNIYVAELRNARKTKKKKKEINARKGKERKK